MTIPEITIVETNPAHIALMAQAMDERSAGMAVKIGMTPKKALWASYRESIICMTAFIDGRIAAMWGIAGTIFSDTGKPWLILASECEEHPFRVAFRYRKELNKFQNMFPCLEEYVDASNKKAIRLLELMGFKVSKNEIPLGDTVFRRAERRVS